MDDERARKNEMAILRGLAQAGQRRVAECMGVSETTVSRMKEAEIGRVGRLLAACGLKAVPVTMRCYRPESIQALLTLAQERLAQIETPEQLVWDED